MYNLKEIIETIALKTEDKQTYDTREKAAQDHQWLINGARNKGREEGVEKGTLSGALIGLANAHRASECHR